jgi:hypothetical protein
MNLGVADRHCSERCPDLTLVCWGVGDHALRIAQITLPVVGRGSRARMRVRYLGVDLAWGEGSESRPANRSGVVALESSGAIVGAGWTIGLDAAFNVSHTRSATQLVGRPDLPAPFAP